MALLGLGWGTLLFHPHLSLFLSAEVLSQWVLSAFLGFQPPLPSDLGSLVSTPQACVLLPRVVSDLLTCFSLLCWGQGGELLNDWLIAASTKANLPIL